MKNVILFTISLTLISFLGLSVFTSGNKLISNNHNPSTVLTMLKKAIGVSVGDKAPLFNLKNVDGKFYSFDNIKDGTGKQPKGYIVIFTCNTCPYAQANEQRIIALHNKYAPQGYPVIAIQPNNPSMKPGDSFDAMKKNAKEKGFPFLYLIDEKQEVSPKYGATKTPEVYLVNNNMVIKYHGAIDDSVRDGDSVKEKFVEKAIQALNKGENPNPATTKAIGCGIKTT